MEEEVKSMNPADIRGENLNLQTVVLKHLDRINYLMSVGRSSSGGDTGYNFVDNYYGIFGGLAALEACVCFKLDKTYWEKSFKYKQRAKEMNLSEGVEWLILMSGWYRLLVKELRNIGLIPNPQEEVDMLD